MVSGIGYEPGRAPGARAAVVDGPGDGVYGDGMYGEALHGADGGPFGAVGGNHRVEGGSYRVEGGSYPAGAPYGPADGPARGGGVELAGRTAEEVLAGYLHRQAAEFLRSLRLHREAGPDAAGAGEAARQLRRAARRISATLHTFRPLTEEIWADQLRAELGWLSGTLAREQACTARRDRLMAALQRLTGRGERIERAAERGGRGVRGARSVREARPAASTATSTVPAAATEPDAESALAAGAARAGALLDRQLTLARTRAHSAALQALGSSRFHAVADALAVLASEAPLARRAGEVSAAEALPPLAELAHRRLAEAVATLPLARAGHPYNADALAVARHQDAPWHQARLLVRLSHYGQEVVAPDAIDSRLTESGLALEHHRDAAEAAAAAAAAARTPRIAPATAYALGVLHADQRHEVEAARYAFGRVWLPGPSVERTG
ncbi:CHAD domain-containing protein [Streptomyces yunnanensis]|uniref:CHAD domain-containing protein n=1 Tax=Streptomyces yunnanensis TaxID=156453 RepID=A0ABY8A8L4_9ACTN|nr:CHAD domain-containing protein [Streptomyces yunnanensis]WEB41044.1 CHAD domain-containing protein [Streptomyces yunnanensis]